VLKLITQLEAMLTYQKVCWVLARMTDSFVANKREAIVATIGIRSSYYSVLFGFLSSVHY